ncbi:Enoyl-(Acyl carrier protein) reductase [Ceratobasidium sp. AG-Ba]|nr:Enoyl-(Acyl carrier protein) reductase [Ceratobasidium sp. AG-Ba]
MARVAIVTGAARGENSIAMQTMLVLKGVGLGRSIALRLAADGIDVAVSGLARKQNDLDQLVREIEALGQRSITIAADVSKENEVQEMVQKTVDTLGGLDIVRMSEDTFDKTMAINCKGTLYCYRAAAAQMIKQGRGGRIIGMSKLIIAHWFLGVRDNVAYATSKFAVRAITQTAALEWGQYNITVNCCAPGVIETDMAVAARAVPDVKKLQDEGIKSTGLQRLGKPEEVASFISFLSSSGASYVTGQTISVDGGMWLS